MKLRYFPNFFAVLRYLSNFFCVNAVFGNPQCPPHRKLENHAFEFSWSSWQAAWLAGDDVVQSDGHTPEKSMAWASYMYDIDHPPFVKS